jgi:hypothetical protein
MLFSGGTKTKLSTKVYVDRQWQNFNLNLVLEAHGVLPGKDCLL